jgi:hypothetical protein
MQLDISGRTLCDFMVVSFVGGIAMGVGDDEERKGESEAGC